MVVVAQKCEHNASEQMVKNGRFDGMYVLPHTQTAFKIQPEKYFCAPLLWGRLEADFRANC